MNRDDPGGGLGAKADAAYISWRAAVISAVTDVESSLVRIGALQSQLAQFEKAEKSSENAYRQLDALYREGLAGFIDVLDAQRTLISTRETLMDMRQSTNIRTARRQKQRLFLSPAAK